MAEPSFPLNSPREAQWAEQHEICSPATKCVITGIILAALTAVVAYYALSHGLDMWDAANSTLHTCQAGILIYVGGTFAFAAAANCIYTGYKLICEGEKMKYEPAGQIASSVFAPVAAVPVIAATVVVVAAGCLGLGCLAMANHH